MTILVQVVFDYKLGLFRTLLNPQINSLNHIHLIYLHPNTPTISIFSTYTNKKINSKSIFFHFQFLGIYFNCQTLIFSINILNFHISHKRLKEVFSIYLYKFSMWEVRGLLWWFSDNMHWIHWFTSTTILNQMSYLCYFYSHL